jgi:DNA-binding GntR family transcriptional regulator
LYAAQHTDLSIVFREGAAVASQGKTEAVYRQLRAQIESWELAPGARLSEVALAERLGASRTPVREAIRRLSREGLVRFTPGEVAQVAPISLRGVRALYEFRMILEPAAVRMVTLDGLSSPALLAPFRQIAEELDVVAAELGDRPREELLTPFYELTDRFDQAIIQACHNEPLATTIADRRGQSARLRGIAHTDPRGMERSLEEHRRICRAMVEGDPDAAARELAQHLAETLRSITEGLTRTARDGGLDIEILPPSA